MLWFHVLFLGRAEGETIIFGVTDSQLLASVFSLALRWECTRTSPFRREHGTWHRLLPCTCPAVRACKLNLPHLLRVSSALVDACQDPWRGAFCLRAKLGLSPHLKEQRLCSGVLPWLSAQGKGTRGWTRFPLLLSLQYSAWKRKKKSGIKFWNLKVRFLCVCSAGVPGGAHGLGTPGGPGPSTLDIHIFPSANLTLATLKAKRVVVGTPQLAGFMWKCLQIH